MPFLRKVFNLPFVVLTLFVCTFFFGDLLSVDAKKELYSVSLFLKDVIVFLLPLVIFSFVMNGVLSLKGDSLKIILLLVPMICLSNFSGFWVSYIFTAPLLETGVITISKLTSHKVLEPAWALSLKPLVKNDVSLISGIVLGMCGIFFRVKFIQAISVKLSVVSNFILKKIICPFLPIFVLGFIVKMQHEGTLGLIMKEYSLLLAVVAVLAYGYMFTVMFFLSSRDIKATFCKFKNLLPGVLIGLCSMSSAAAIPSTITGSEKNLHDKNIARFVVPATANMHLLGDCFAIPIIGLALMVSFGYPFPTFSQYLVFSLYGVVAKFAAAGIPGGSAIIFVPIFESIFGFNPEMLTAITAIYLLFDPIATSSNVFGHGMFAILFEKTYVKMFGKRKKFEPN